MKQDGDDPKGTGQAGGRKKEKKRMCMRNYWDAVKTLQALDDCDLPGPAGLAVKAAGLAHGQRGFDSHRSHAR